MIEHEEYEEDLFDYDNAVLELKKALFEICKTDFDRSSAYSRLLDEHGPLVVDVFSDDPFETEPAFEDFYEYNDYEDPETGECMTFSDWAEYFADQDRREIVPVIFDLLRQNCSEEKIIQKLESEYDELSCNLNLCTEKDLVSFMENEKFEDDFLGIEQSLLEWREFFRNDEFDLYGTCIELTEQNEILRQQLKDIKNIIDKDN